MSSPKVTINTPTKNRHHFLPLIGKCVEQQNFENLEWLILDDSNERFKPFETKMSSNIKYIYSDKKITIGEKRNIIISEAKGDIIINFDDDDYYSPNYVSHIVSIIEQNGFDFLNLRGFFLHHSLSDKYAYWDLSKQNGLHFEFGPSELKSVIFDDSKSELIPNLSISYGFGYAYKKSVWKEIKIPDLDWKEDVEFALKVREQFKIGGVFDNIGLCMHFIHSNNTSLSYPQFILPERLVGRFFNIENINEYMNAGR